MRTHSYAARLSLEHPVLESLGAFLKDRKLDDEEIWFLGRQIYFAYPRTLWFKLGVDTNWRNEQEARDADRAMCIRHRLDSGRIGGALSAWLVERSETNKIVFDLSNITIFDAAKMGQLFAATAAEPGGAKYLLCPPELRARVTKLPGVKWHAIFEQEWELLEELRSVPLQRECMVKLPAVVDGPAMEKALRRQATPEKLRDCDAIVFNVRDVLTVSFEAHAMFSPVIHSLAHTHGILASVWSPVKIRSRVEQSFEASGSLRPMTYNLIHTPASLIRHAGIKEKSNRWSMHTFDKDVVGKVLNHCFRWLSQCVHDNISWFASVSRISEECVQGVDIEEMVGELWEITHELVDNVVGHAGGLGYVMMELNTQPDLGFSIYVGDTGIGMAQGLKNSYGIQEPLSHKRAAEMAMNLADKFKDRRSKMQGRTERGGGRGLLNVRTVLQTLRGTIAIRTGDARAHFSFAKKNTPLKVASSLFYLQGTHIHIHIPTRWKAL